MNAKNTRLTIIPIHCDIQAPETSSDHQQASWDLTGMAPPCLIHLRVKNRGSEKVIITGDLFQLPDGWKFYRRPGPGEDRAVLESVDASAAELLAQLMAVLSPA